MFRHEPQYLAYARQTPGQYQVAHDQTADRHAIDVEQQVAHLAVHLAQACAVDARVVRHTAQRPGDGRVVELGVGHVDVDDAIEQAQRHGRVVPTGVL